MDDYRNRILDELLVDYLKAFGAVLIKGPKWCGKTTTATQKAKSVLKLQDTSKRNSYERTIDIEPGLLLQGDNPRLIDEWQTYPILWDAVRTEVDDRNEKGLFILTGSSVPQDNITMHTGTGRIAKLDMSTMSLFEAGQSFANISLSKLFNDENYIINGLKSNLNIHDLIEITCKGGWPANLSNDIKSSLLVTKQYFNSVCDEDINRVDGSEKDPSKVGAILRSYARNVSTLVSNQTLLRDINSMGSPMSEPTLYSYLNALKRLYIIDEIPAWNPSIRSATSIRATTKKIFSDPSIAIAALGLTPNILIDDLQTFGFLFENLCIRDLRVYSSSLGGSISYYRDRSGLEADCVLHLDDGRYALIEFKLGSREIEVGAEHLLKIKYLTEKNNIKSPSLLMVLTGGEMAYKRKDGVFVIPIGCLKP
jgi:predicted AAA+ superfamily ATPase